jgi:hypothetical protein
MGDMYAAVEAPPAVPGGPIGIRATPDKSLEPRTAPPYIPAPELAYDDMGPWFRRKSGSGGVLDLRVYSLFKLLLLL